MDLLYWAWSTGQIGLPQLITNLLKRYKVIYKNHVEMKDLDEEVQYEKGKKTGFNIYL